MSGSTRYQFYHLLFAGLQIVSTLHLSPLLQWTPPGLPPGLPAAHAAARAVAGRAALGAGDAARGDGGVQGGALG